MNISICRYLVIAVISSLASAGAAELNITQDIKAAYIDGLKIDLANRHTHLRDKYLEKYRRPAR